jgi:hypothetical protein
VEIDPRFVANVTVNAEHPLRVFVQLEENDGTYGVVVKNKTSHGFDVVEIGGGASDMPFQWHVVCNRVDEALADGQVSHNADARFEVAAPNRASATLRRPGVAGASSALDAAGSGKGPFASAGVAEPAWLRALLPSMRR